MPGTDGAWTTTRFVDMADLRHDMHVNIVTFQPGGAIPFPETHVMEHGLYVLEGKAVYLLNEDWVEVEAGRLHVAARVLSAGLLRRRSRPVPLPALQGRQPARAACRVTAPSADGPSSDAFRRGKSCPNGLLFAWPTSGPLRTRAQQPVHVVTATETVARMAATESTVNGEPATLGRRAAAHHRPRLAARPRPDRRQGGLRRGRVRRLRDHGRADPHRTGDGTHRVGRDQRLPDPGRGARRPGGA